MDKSEVYPLFFITIFLSFYLVGLAAITPMLVSGQNFQYTNAPDIGQLSIDRNYTYFPVTYALPADSNSSYIGETYIIHYGGHNYYRFSPYEGHVLLVNIERAEGIPKEWYPFKYLYIYQAKGGYFDGAYEYTIQKNQLLEKCDNSSSYQQLDLTFRAQHVYRISIAPLNYTYLYDAILNDEWILSISEGTGNFTVSGGNNNAILGLLSFNLPNIDPMVNFILATPVWVCVIYLGVRIALWFIPLVSGGN